ncbi:hypothetical protein PLICRDRAFT_699853 [Plicaturopsis crispa FD-325 SS-3]|nr:hypothetical protein PLICRDRAFT_699853 [Plicaturopsis crispa FD-325 SS-3]
MSSTTPTTATDAPAPATTTSAPETATTSAAAATTTDAPAPAPGAAPVPPTTDAAAPESAPAPAATAKPEEIKAEESKVEETKAGGETKAEEKEKPEPQNALTEKFTADEWKALKEFRADIPNILAAAFPDEGDAALAAGPLVLWGVTISPEPADARASVILMKFLRARNLNPSAARDMLVATLRWRASFKADTVATESFPEDVFGGLGYNYGKDKEGRPVTYNLYGAAAKDVAGVFGDIQRFLRWRVSLMEKSIALLDFTTTDQVIQVHDYAGVSLLSSRDPNSKAAAREATSIFSDYYPEFLARKFFINVPSLLSWIFWAFTPLISAATRAKMRVVSGGTHGIKKALGEVIADGEIPKRYGGEAEGF